VSAKQRPSATVHAIQRPGCFPYAVTPFLGGPLFDLLLCNGRCLCLLMGIFQEINSSPHWRIWRLHQSCWHCAFVRCRSHTEWLTGGCVCVVCDLCVGNFTTWCTVTIIRQPCFVLDAVTPFLKGPLFHLLMCNSRCLCLLMGIFQKINSTPHWRIGCLH